MNRNASRKLLKAAWELEDYFNGVNNGTIKQTKEDTEIFDRLVFLLELITRKMVRTL